MEKELLQQAVDNGIWVTLFVVLFLYTIMDSRNREKKYQEREDSYRKMLIKNQTMTRELSKQFCIVEKINDDVSEIKHALKRRDN